VKVFRHVSQLFALNDVALVDALYRTVLKRAPDPDGQEFYVGQLRSGRSKASIIADIAGSPEAKAAGLELPGLRRYVAAQKWRARSPLRLIGYRNRRESQMHRLENSLGRILDDVHSLRRELQKHVESTETGPNFTSEKEIPLPVEPSSPPPDDARSADLSGVPLMARRIFRELSAAIEAVDKPKTM
jgi:hypothetical protein